MLDAEGKLMVTRRTDPEPITIYMAILATYAASVATVNYVKANYKPLPTKVRARLVKHLAELSDHVRHLRTDLSIIEDIFRNASFPNGQTIRLGNGAHLMPSEFSRYEVASDDVFRRLRAVHKISLKVEREATRLSGLDLAPTTNVLGETYARLEKLLDSQNLTVERAWEELRAIAGGLERAIEELRRQIDAA